ncbi:hypothetical protein HI914_06095 [Erysiphe necator]|nr:hypothetical protein HI914_06095 [Erysiphe necator]
MEILPSSKCIILSNHNLKDKSIGTTYSEWNEISLRKMFIQQPDKSRPQVLKEMIEKLQQIQCSLGIEFQSETAFRNKIKSACANVPSCSSAIIIPTTTLSGLVNNLVTAISHDNLVKQADKIEPINFT